MYRKYRMEMTDQMTATQTEQDKESRGGWIYKIVFPNGKHYIGLTTRSIERRTKDHRYAAKHGDTKCLYRAIRKYDMVDTFELAEIDTADSIDELCELEIQYIKEYNSYYLDGGNGYNMTMGGNCVLGYVFTEDDKRRMSEGRKKYLKDHPEAIKKLSDWMKKQFENPETRQKICEGMKKYYKDNPEAGKTRSDILKKLFKDRPELREKKSEIMKKRYENPDEIKKTLDSRGYNKPFDVFKRDGLDWIGTFAYQFEAIEYLKKEYEHIPKIEGVAISRVLAGTTKSSKGFIFKYSDPLGRKNVDFDELYIENKKKMLDMKGKNKPFMVFKCDDESLVSEFTYQFEAHEYLEKEYEHIPKIEDVEISKVLAGKIKSSKGFTFKYSDPLDRKNVNFDERYIENKKKMLDMKGKNKPFMVFKRDDESLVSEFTYQFEAKEYLKKEYGVTSEISKVLAGKLKHSKGFIFKYK